MKHTLAALTTAVLTVVVAAAPASAQDDTGPRTVRIGVAAGLAMPMGDFGDGAEMGFNVTGTVDAQPAALPVGVRLDLMYNRFGFEGEGDGSASILAGLLNAILSFGTQTSMQPYLIGGVGVYRAGIDVDLPPGVPEPESETAFGVGLGGGVRFPLSGFDTYVEARFHNAFTEGSSTTFLPITFGLRF
jgi:opacity protein-like surface antigen